MLRTPFRLSSSIRSRSVWKKISKSCLKMARTPTKWHGSCASAQRVLGTPTTFHRRPSPYPRGSKYLWTSFAAVIVVDVGLSYSLFARAKVMFVAPARRYSFHEEFERCGALPPFGGPRGKSGPVRGAETPWRVSHVNQTYEFSPTLVVVAAASAVLLL